MRPLRDLLDLDNTKAAKSVCPSAFILSGMMHLHLNWGRGVLVMVNRIVIFA